MQVSIDEQGNVIEAKLIEGNKIFEENAVKAAMLAKFKPSKYFVDGQSVKSFGVLVFNFVLDENIQKDIALGSPLNLPKPPLPFCNCKYGTKKPQVFVEIEIDENGNVISANAISGHPVLRAACEVAARNSKFSQTKISGVPVKAKAVLIYEFNLDDDSKTITVKSIEPIPQKQASLIISYGKFDNHAVLLVKPEYPKAASYVKSQRFGRSRDSY